jgi:hypothetical protein
MSRVADIRIDGKAAKGTREYVTLHVRRLLTRLPVRPLAVRVCFSDDNGPKGGGPDIRCRMLVTLPSESPITVEHVATRPRLAFHRVYERIRRQLEHPRRRWRESRRHPTKYFAAKRLWT